MDIKELENKINELQKKLEEYKKECRENNNEEWTPKDGELYFYFDLDTETTNFTYWRDEIFGNIRKSNNLIFKTEEEAKEYAEYYQAKKKANDEFSNDEWKNDNIKKYHIYLDYYNKEIYFVFTYTYRQNIVYFRTEEDSKNYIKKYKKFICREFGVNEKDVSIEE